MSSIEIAPGYDRYATVHPDNLTEFAQHLESIGVHLAVDLVLHRRLWAQRNRPGLRTAEVVSLGSTSKLGMIARRSCLACHEEWGMHHRCPAAGGRFNCC